MLLNVRWLNGHMHFYTIEIFRLISLIRRTMHVEIRRTMHVERYRNLSKNLKLKYMLFSFTNDILWQTNHIKMLQLDMTGDLLTIQPP